MRITGGKLNRRKLLLPKKDIRASMDKMRERVFSILENIIGDYSDYNFLDLFSGSSIIAVEAYSRGFKFALGVEQDFGKKKVYRKKCRSLQFLC